MYSTHYKSFQPLSVLSVNPQVFFSFSDRLSVDVRYTVRVSYCMQNDDLKIQLHVLLSYSSTSMCRCHSDPSGLLLLVTEIVHCTMQLQLIWIHVRNRTRIIVVCGLLHNSACARNVKEKRQKTLERQWFHLKQNDEGQRMAVWQALRLPASRRAELFLNVLFCL